jgi:glycosyltransferase involved in cell wall biosynthesis
MLRVANIIEEGRLGGPQVRICDVAYALKNDIDTIVILPKSNSDRFQEKLRQYAVNFKLFDLTRITKELRMIVRYILFSGVEIFRLTRFFKDQKINLIHVSGGAWQYKGVIAGKLAGKKVLWHLNDTSMPSFIRGVFSLISPMADGFIYASERTKAYYQPLIRASKQGSVIPAPVDTAQFDPQHEYPGDEELLAELAGKFVVGTVANINPIKGLSTLIRSAAISNKLVGNTVFVVIGKIYPAQARYYESLLKLCDELGVLNVMFVGGRSDVRPLLKRFDAYVCCSDAESSPISVWEAMSMSKAIVSTDVGDVALYVKEGVNGFIVDANSSEALAERIISIAGDESLRREFGERCRDVAVQELDISHCAKRHIEAYSAIHAE